MPRGFGSLNAPILFSSVYKNATNGSDPKLSGTNDHAGDYRSSGCSACHVIYANDRNRSHSGFMARREIRVDQKPADVTIPK